MLPEHIQSSNVDIKIPVWGIGESPASILLATDQEAPGTRFVRTSNDIRDVFICARFCIMNASTMLVSR